MGMFDQTARQACKLNGGPFFAWLLRRFDPPPPLVFERWDDTRRQPLPGGPDRTDDVVAVLQHTEAAEQRTWLIVEVETEPERFIFHRLGIYGLLLSMELVRGPGPVEEPPVGTVPINLTGQPRRESLRLVIPGTSSGQTVTPLVVNLRQQDAATTLAGIAAGQTGLCLLPWLPLLAGGGEPALIAEWKRVALTEPDPQRRSLYRNLALVLAELARELVNWQQALEGWQMQESQVILGWMKRGEQKAAVETNRARLLDVLRTRLQDPVPEPVRLAIEGTNDPDILTGWFKTALTVSTLDEFLAVMNQKP
ncbi:MAG: hypothetical protein L0Z62_24555 [Gemmataceae bacterium]|nr:hypothetical protein [Gemmataceae bacterium]